MRIQFLRLSIFRTTSRCLLAVMVSLTISPPVLAKLGAPPLSTVRQTRPLPEIQQLVLPATDIAAELAADRQRAGPAPVRFAVAHQLAVTPKTHGTWEQLADGRLWRLRLLAPGATNLNLGFTRFWLPEGATLHVLAQDQAYFQGPYTAQDNRPHGQLWTPLVPGRGLVLELFIPNSAQAEPQLVLSQVGAGYRDLFRIKGPLPSPLVEGSCNLDVVCPQAATWTNEIRSVGLYTINGAWACTGTLLADAAGDFRSYFLTANHCGLNTANAPTVVVYWNYESATCGTHGPGSLAQNQSGATFRAARTDVDFALIELDSMPEPGFGVYYSGWDRSGAAPAGGVGIHHPESDVKAISFSSNALTTVNSCIGTGGVNTHWQVIWSAGVTEPGSSGSGIWDSATHRLVGTLSGGGSSCSTPYSPDCYGKFSVSWSGGGSSAERLSDWLDPENTGVASLPGIDPARTSVIVANGVSLMAESCTPTNGAIDPGETVTVSFAMKNLGGVTATNLVATLLATGGVQLPSEAQSYGAVIAGGAAVSRSFTFTAQGTCGGPLTPVFQLADGSRNLGTLTFALMLGNATPNLLSAQDFDGVVAPALPGGWTASLSGAGTAWATSTAQFDTPPNAAFAGDPPAISDNQLLSPPFLPNSGNAQLVFHHSYDLETGYDGGVLEVSVNGGVFSDLLAAGGWFVANGYNATLSSYYQNPLAGRQAWSGNSGGFITTVAQLPSVAPNATLQLRWRLGTDNGTGAGGWSVDSISLTQTLYTCCASLLQPVLLNPRFVGHDAIAFSYDSAIGQAYFIEGSTNLLTGWFPLQTNPGNGSLLSYTNSTAGAKQFFFRLRTQ